MRNSEYSALSSSAAPALRRNTSCYYPLDMNVAINVTNRKYFDLLHECHAVWPQDTSHVKKLTDSMKLIGG
jgi:hypothetical protein